MLCFLTFAQQSRQIHVNRLWSSLYKCINNAYCLEVLWYIHLCIYTYIIDILCGILCVCVCVCECGKGECVHAQSYPTLCDPMDYSPPGSSVHGILRQEYWSGLPWPPPGGLPDQGIEPTSSASPTLIGGFFTTSATWLTASNWNQAKRKQW